MIDGNTAGALGAISGGVTFAAWYPITPSPAWSTLQRLPAQICRIAGGQGDLCVVQAEDELAAIGMVLGAGWAGARAMTATPAPASR